MLDNLLLKKNKRNIGNQYELIAENYLKNQKLQTVEKNFSSPMGEIDLIMSDGTTLIFIEVRYRAASKFGSAIETITLAKQRKIMLTAEFYLQKHKQYQLTCCRFDVIGIDKSSSGHLEINWIKHAFME